MIWETFSITLPEWLDDSLVNIYWPLSLQPLCERHGAARVFKVGLNVLEYPPTWCNKPEQFMLVYLDMGERYGSRT